MATRMQQRRGTAAQWTAANPILAAGEIGFETDTNKFKMGNGSSAWSALQYFANAAELAAIIDGAPDLLNTLNELAEAIGEDPTFFTTVASNLSAHASDTTSVHGIANTALLATQQNVDDKIATAVLGIEGTIGTPLTEHTEATTGIHGIADTDQLATKDYADDAVTAHNGVSLNVHGIADTSALALTSDISAHSNDTSNVHGIEDTQALATKTYADDAVSTHNSDGTNVHGISDTANLVYTADLNDHTGSTLNVHGIADTADLVTTTILGVHTNDTTGVHGIADTADLVTTSMLADAVTPSALGYAGLAGVGLDYDAVNDALDIDSTVATKQYADDSVSAHNTETLNVHGIANTANLATTSQVNAAKQDAIDLAAVASELYADSLATNYDAAGTASGAVTAHNNDTTGVHGITDTSKLVTTDAQATTLDGSLTVQGDLTVNGTNFAASATSITIEDNLVQLAHQNAANTVDLGIVVGYTESSTAKHSGLVRDVSDAQWKLFKGVTTEPSTTVDFTQGSLDDLAVNNITAAGVIFTDGTQTKEGTPSRTPIIQKTAAYTLSSLTERDSLIEVSHTGGSAVNVTIPADSTLNLPIGTSIDVLQTNTGAVAIAAGAGVTVNATPGLTLRTQWSSATLFKRAANTWVVYGDLK